MNNINSIALSLILLITVIDVIGWYCIKKYHLTGKIHFFLVTLTGYVLIAFLLLQVLKYEGIGMTNMIWNIMSTIIVLLIGYYIYKEQINNLQLTGILLGMLSILILYLSEKNIK